MKEASRKSTGRVTRAGHAVHGRVGRRAGAQGSGRTARTSCARRTDRRGHRGRQAAKLDGTTYAKGASALKQLVAFSWAIRVHWTRAAPTSAVSRRQHQPGPLPRGPGRGGAHTTSAWAAPGRAPRCSGARCGHRATVAAAAPPPR
ncbi:hypothetical protein QJS66_03410 [Kocuria rhizophila]|nr:hypothetical protein QJS66_03410 [Kocuria rhizophila]